MTISLPRTSRSLIVALVGSFLMVVSAAAVTSARNSRRNTGSSSSSSSGGGGGGGGGGDSTSRSRRRPHDGAEAEVSSTEVLPAAIATWSFGKIAVDAAAELLADGGTALDATEAGVTAVELDTQDQYFVGLGGLPNANGQMEFDAAVMEGTSMSYGAVLAVSRGVVKAFSAARVVMERSPHSVLAGEGATTFAVRNGIEAAETLTDDAKQQFEDWRRQYQEEEGSDQRGESHDTVGVICLDHDGNLCAGTSTSGWKFKHPGRVGDAPVVGSGLYCDSTVGAAVATGDGEEILRTCLSFAVVEFMRGGDSPQLACKKGIARLEETVKRSAAGRSVEDANGMHDRLTVAVMAINPKGDIGAASTLGPRNMHRGRPAFPLAIWRKGDPVRVVEETEIP
ncbi:unnamed protein product [Ectocarpus sp. 12 AP-2014]